MRAVVGLGRVYRRSGCRDPHHHRLGASCPALAADPGHGTWTFAVDLPSPTPGRHTVRRGGYPTEESARAALRRLLEGHNSGFTADPNHTVADYLTAWLRAKTLVLKPTTMARYRAYVTNDLIPALGSIRLDDLGYPHIAGLVHTQLARGRVTVHQILATLSSALGDAVRHHRLATNPARPTVMPRPAAAERHIWTPNEAVRFLRYCHAVDPPFADLIEVPISPRVATALRNRADDRAPAAVSAPRDGLVFHRPDGRPLHPEYVLNHFHDLSRDAGVSRTTIHDLRHLAATISITAGVPLTVLSKTLRHSTLSTTANIYSHLSAQAARDAVDTIDKTLTAIDGVGTPPAHMSAASNFSPRTDSSAPHRAVTISSLVLLL